MTKMISGLSATEYHRRYYYKRRAKLMALVGDECAWCGTKEDLEFDHIDPDAKEFNISSNMTASNEVVQAELAKCQMLCRECHIEKTVAKDEFNADRRRTRNSGTRGPYGRPTTHGDPLHYKRGCRCEECRSAIAKKARERYAAKRDA